MQKAFTLIELLVVVLIIGILSAIALPKYQLAVDKARYAEMQVVSKSLAQAIEVYYMANNKYPDYWAELDIGVEGCTESNIAKYLLTCKNFTIDLNDENFVAIPIQQYVVRLTYGFSNGAVGHFRCTAGDDRGRRICKSVCGTADCYVN